MVRKRNIFKISLFTINEVPEPRDFEDTSEETCISPCYSFSSISTVINRAAVRCPYSDLGSSTSTLSYRAAGPDEHRDSQSTYRHQNDSFASLFAAAPAQPEKPRTKLEALCDRIKTDVFRVKKPADPPTMQDRYKWSIEAEEQRWKKARKARMEQRQAVLDEEQRWNRLVKMRNKARHKKSRKFKKWLKSLLKI